MGDLFAKPDVAKQNYIGTWIIMHALLTHRSSFPGKQRLISWLID
jgi:hypothetical protein